MPESVSGEVLLKVEDNITTDHIMPAGAKVLPLRSNIPKIAEFVYYQVDETFASRAKEKGGGFIVGGENYGQGSSREHAALAPMYLGIKMVLTKSFARIHLANLINFGILPATFANPADYDDISQGDRLEMPGMRQAIADSDTLEIENKTKSKKYTVNINLTPRQRKIILAGGLLNYTKAGGK
jgi:aconitate hydratase